MDDFRRPRPVQLPIYGRSFSGVRPATGQHNAMGSRQSSPLKNQTWVRVVYDSRLSLRLGSVGLHFVLPMLQLTATGKERLSVFRDLRVRVAMGAAIVLVVVSEVINIYQPFMTQHAYALGSAGSLLLPVSQEMADKLKYATSDQSFSFNAGYTPSSSSNQLNATGSQVTASAYQDGSKGMTVSDPVNNISFTTVPKFGVSSGRQDGNRLVYPLGSGNGWLVYSMHSVGVKEDLLLTGSGSDSTSFDYNLGLGNNLAVRPQSNGSLGIYGNTLFSGSITTGSASDAALLKKAEAKALKNTLLFTIPAPTVEELGQGKSNVQTKFTVDKDTLHLTVSGLDKAHYPLTIDPSIYVVTAAQFMRGNNETNIDFDVADKLIRKAPTTGARFNSWNTTTNLPLSVWNQGTAIAGGYAYSIGGLNANATIFTTAGTSTYVVPTGVTSITVKAWGAGGGGGAGSGSTGVGGAGGGGAYVTGTITGLTGGQSLNIDVGNSGIDAPANRNGGSGGGYSAVRNGASFLLIAAGGGGGGGTNTTTTGGAGSGGGSGTAGGGGSGTTPGGGGGAGTSGAGGAGGAAGGNGVAGAAGIADAGGDGAGSQATCTTVMTGHTGGGGGTGSGKGGNAANCEGGGGGGSGRFGGGGGGDNGNTNARAAGGGGGGSDLIPSGGSETAGSGQNPGNLGDSVRNGAGQGGAGGTSSTTSSAGTNGLVFITYGSGSTVTNEVDWAQFDTTSGAVDSPDPGTGACAGWCTASSYNLPSGRAGFSVVAYNGFLYVLGGVSDTAGTLTNTVYIAKLGANGEPQLWHPTDTNKNNWVYWYTSTNTLPTNIAYGSAVAYNDRLYILGGKTTANAGGDSIVQVSSLNPTGDIGAWSSTGMTQLSSGATARFGLSAQVYNGTIYILGGNNSGTLKNDVYYMKLQADGTMAMSTWTQTNSFLTPRMMWGGNFTTVWGAYIYISGGCSAVNGSGYCTTVASDTQLASINTDGSLDIWNTNASVTDQRMGYGLAAWRNYIYEFGGCTSQNTTDGSCIVSGFDDSINTVSYGTINQDGDASTVAQSSASGLSTCSGGSPYNCDMPSTIGNVLNEAVIMKGYLYIMGGCTNNGCTTVSTSVMYQSIAGDGTLQKPATCPGGSYTDSYCVSPSTLPVGLAAAATAVFNGRIYLVGGFNTGTNIYYVSVNDDGSLGAWSGAVDLSTIGAANTLTYAYAFARANPSSAGTNPGNLYILGGCTDGSIGCSNYSDGVYKCNIGTAGAPSGCCSTSCGQQQIGTITNNGHNCGVGLGAMAGTIYANYIYLIGGLTPNGTTDTNCIDLKTVRYAKIDNNNNIVAVTGSAWVVSPVQTQFGRRRGAGFGYNGYLYVLGGYDGTGGGGVLPDIEFAKVNVTDGSLIDQSNGLNQFNVSAVQFNHRWGLAVPLSNSFAYVVGGCITGAAPSSCTARTSTIQTFQIYNNDSGTPDGYTSSLNYGTNRIGVASAVLNGYIYAAGGCTTANDCGAALGTVSYAAINANGGIGSWTPGNALPSSNLRAWGKLLAAGGSLYYVGGQDSTGTVQSTVFYTTSISSGNPTWSSTAATRGIGDTGSGGQARTKFGAAVWNNRLYVVGGLNTGGTATATIYVSPQLNSGGNISSAWSTSSTSLSIARYGAVAVTYANNLYVLGGNDGTNYLSDAQYAQIDTTTGDSGSWTYTTSLPTGLALGDGFAANGYMYLIGGRSSSGGCRSISLVAPISANTSISSGNNPTGVGDWYETNSRYTGSRYGNAAVYSSGTAYVLGGACASTTAPAVASVTSTPTTNTGFNGTNSTTHNVQMPASVAAGDLLMVFLSTDDNATVTTPTGWTALTTATSGAGGVTGSIYAKLAAGTEGGTQVNFVTSSTQLAAAHTYRILAANWYGDSSNSFANSIVTSTASTSTGTNAPNPAALTFNNWDTETNLWIAFAAGSTYTSVTTYPTSYTGNQTHSTSNCTTTDCASASTANRSLLAASEDPGAFTMNASQASVAYTVAVRPPLAYNGSNEVQQTGLLSQPQIAQYSIMFDTDSDVYPNIWLLNGVDNSVGANWQLLYRSMTNPLITNPTLACTFPVMSTWGADTNFGNVTLGKPGAYVPKNGSGTNTNCARYFYFLITVDSSQAYGYPDDVSRGPTITDLTLGFTADPSKRLMHGRTFIGGIQQPDDTPCHQSAGANYAACPLP